MFIYVTSDYKVFKTKKAVEEYINDKIYLSADIYKDGWKKYIKVKVK